MNSTVQAISSGASRMPAAVPFVQANSGQNGNSGFTSALAAAQNFSDGPERSAATAESTGHSQSQRASTTSNPSTPGSSLPQPGKRLNTRSAALSTASGTSAVISDTIAANTNPAGENSTAGVIPQTIQFRTIVEQASLLQLNLVPTAVTAPSSLNPQGPVDGQIALSFRPMSNGMALPNASSDNPVQPYAGTLLVGPAYPGDSLGSLAAQTVKGAAILNEENGGRAQETTLVTAVSQPPIVGIAPEPNQRAVSSKAAAGSRSNFAGSGPNSNVQAAGTSGQPTTLATTTANPSHATNLRDSSLSGFAGALQSSNLRSLTESEQPSDSVSIAGQSAYLNAGLNLQNGPTSQGSGEHTFAPARGAIGQSEFAADAVSASATRLESGNSEAAITTEGDLISTANFPIPQVNSWRGGSAPASGAQTDFSVESIPGVPLAAIANNAISAAPSSTQAIAGKMQLTFLFPRTVAAVASPTAAAESQSAGSPSAVAATAAAASSTGALSGAGSASQTPFSVFFSTSGPGTESAAGALPKMILPAASYAARFSHASVADSASGSPSNSGVQHGVSPVAATQNAKDPSAGSESGVSPNAPVVRHDAELSVPSVPLISPPASASSPTPVAPAVDAVAASQPPLASASLPMPQLVPVPGSSSPAALPATATPPVLGPVQVAQMVTRLEQSEMRIGMNTSAFGSVDVRAVIHANDVGLVIGSERGDLRALLANDMPSITNSLQQQNLRLNTVNFMQGFAFSNNASGGGDPEQRSFVPMRAAAHSVLSDNASGDSTEHLPAVGFGSSGISLSILA